MSGQECWPLAEPLDRGAYPPEAVAMVPWRDVVWAHADGRAIVSDSGGVRGLVGIVWRDGAFGGKRLRIAGIGGVMTSPHVRRKGHAGAAMLRAARLMEEEQVDFGLLFCEPHNERFCENLGWNLFEGTVWTGQPRGPIWSDLMRTYCLAQRIAPRQGVIDPCGPPW